MSVSRRDFMLASASAGAVGWALQNGSKLVAAETAPAFAPPGEMKVKYFGQFSELPLGSVKPAGWIKGWLDRQVQGLTGHPENLGYPYDTCMYAGKIPPPAVKHGDIWWPYEQSGYFVDGATRTGILLDTPEAQKIPQANIEYILEHSGHKNLGESTWGWPNTVIGRALIAEYGGTGNTAAAQVLLDYVLNTNIGPSRDGFIAEEAFYLYGLTGDVNLLHIATGCYNRFFYSDAKSFSNEARIRGQAPLREHGVTAAEQLKLLPLMFAYTGDARALELAKIAYEKVVADSLMPDGGVVSSESMSTTAFNSLHETCDITDWSWSIGYMLMASGEGKWADIIERATFNALPGAVTKDFKQLQYFSSANQVLASSTACPRIAMTRMSYRAAHETECCSGNVNRAMPNYVSRMWMRCEDGLAAVLYGPASVHTQVNGQAVSIVEETDYPFRDTITFTLRLAQQLSFALQMRIPDWCAHAVVSINGAPADVSAAAGTFAVIKRAFHDGDVVVLRLPMEAVIEDWFNGAAGVIRRGPLVYSLKIEEKRVESLHEPDAIRRVLKGNNVQGFPAVEFFPASEWRVGLDIQKTTPTPHLEVVESPMPENPFLAETSPVYIRIMLRSLPGWAPEWKAETYPPPADLRQAPKNPAALPDDAALRNPGPLETTRMVPYGSTHLRLTTLPKIPATA